MPVPARRRSPTAPSDVDAMQERAWGFIAEIIVSRNAPPRNCKTSQKTWPRGKPATSFILHSCRQRPTAISGLVRSDFRWWQVHDPDL
jgi:hypothetical protein